VFAAITEQRTDADRMGWREALRIMAAKRTGLDQGLLTEFVKMFEDL